MTPAVRYVGFAGLVLFAATVTFLVFGCRSRWRWFEGFVVGDDLAAGDPDDDIWETAGTRPDTVGQLITRINARRAARNKPPLERAELDAALRQIQLELDSAEETRWRS